MQKKKLQTVQDCWSASSVACVWWPFASQTGMVFGVLLQSWFQMYSESKQVSLWKQPGFPGYFAPASVLWPTSEGIFGKEYSLVVTDEQSLLCKFCYSGSSGDLNAV